MTKATSTFDVAVIGAGPAGILAAISAAQSGANVILCEKNEAIGRKILATGNGRCNISNTTITADRYHGTDVSTAMPILNSFNATTYFESIGVLLKEEDRGRLFPRTNQASSVVDALKAELNRLGVIVKTGYTVKGLLPGKPWTMLGENGDEISAATVILTTGGRAAHQFGSSGDGLFWAKNLEHDIVPIHAALVPLETEETWVKDIMGIRLTSRVRLFADNNEIASREGDIIFTHFGISGPAVMGLAREVDPLLAAGKSVTIVLDLTPDLSNEKLDTTLATLASSDGKKLVRSNLSGLVPKNIIPQIMAMAGVNIDQKAAETSKKQRQDIIHAIKNFKLTASKVRPLKEAQVTAGGISLPEVTADLESKKVPGLYFAGEILDIDGDSGGFNLQWAWASGKLAGDAAARSSKCTD